MTYDPWGLPTSPSKQPGPHGSSGPDGQPTQSWPAAPDPQSIPGPGVGQSWPAASEQQLATPWPGQSGDTFQPSGASPPVVGRQPALTLTVVVTLLAGAFGLVPAALHSSQAKQSGLDGSRYWKAFGVILGAQVAVLAILAFVVPGLLGSILERFSGGGASAAEPAATQAQAQATEPVDQPSAAGPTTAWSPAPSPTPHERSGREEPNRDPDFVTVQAGSSGTACTATAGQSSWGRYPVAQCRTWKPTTGLVSGAALSTRTLSVTCQANLQEANPVYTAKQTNTWWFWAQADNGTWDWFPETALAQGASNESVNGVALCR